MARKEVVTESVKSAPEVSPEVKASQDNTLEVARQAYLTGKSFAVDDDGKVVKESEPATVKESYEQQNDAVESAQEPKKDREYTDIERQAIDEGWKHLEEFTGDKEKWRDAKSWVHMTDTFKRLEMSERRNEDLRKEVTNLIELYKHKEAKETEDRIQKLEKARIEAIRSGDVDEVIKIENILKDNNSTYGKIKPSENKNSYPDEVGSFIERNKSWFLSQSSTKTRAMTQFAKDLENEYANKYPELSLNDRLVRVERETKEAFNIQEVRNVAPAEAKHASVSRSSSYPDFRDLPSDFQKIISDQVELDQHRYKRKTDKTNMLTNEKYIKKLVDTNVMDRKGNLIK